MLLNGKLPGTLQLAWRRAARRCVELALVLGTVFPAQAQEATVEDEELRRLDAMSLEDLLKEPVVTAAGGEGEERAMTPANVVSISSATIARQGWRSLAEILAHVPGLYVVDDHVLPSLGVRGVTGGPRAGTRIVKIMINGYPISFRPDLTAFLGPEFIPIEAVEHVEIVKGPLSALYGANAFIATVNVITRTPQNAFSASAAGRVTLIQSRPGYGASFLAAQKSSSVDLLVSMTLDELDRSGLSVRNTFPLELLANDSVVSQDDRSRPMSLYAQVGLTTERFGRWTLAGGLQKSDSSAEFQINSLLTHLSRQSLVNGWAHLKYEQSSGRLSWGGQLGFSQGGPTSDNRAFLTGNYVDVYTQHLDYRAGSGTVFVAWRPLEERLSLKVGVDVEYSHEDVLYYTQTYGADKGEHKAGDRVDLVQEGATKRIGVSGLGAYLQATSSPFLQLPNLRLSGNIRVDRIAFGEVLFPLQLSWRGALAYRWSDSVVTKIIAGSSFQTPSGVLLYGISGFGASNNVVGALNVPVQTSLRPQIVTNVEAIGVLQPAEWISLEIGVYYQILHNKIEFARVPISGHYFARNGGERRSVGVEPVIRLSFGWLKPYLSGGAELLLTPAAVPELAPAQYPTLMGVAGVDLELPYVNVAASVRVVGPRGATQANILINGSVPYALPGYQSLDVAVSTRGIRFFEAGETVARIRGTNLLNTRYDEPGFSGFDVPALGRTVQVEINQTF